VSVQAINEVVDPLPGRGRRLYDRRLPRALAVAGCGDHRAQVPDRLLGAGPVALVHHEDVGDLQDSGLGGLDGITHPRRDDHQGRVRQGGDLDLGLAHPTVSIMITSNPAASRM
jgi:hypothetical protein